MSDAITFAVERPTDLGILRDYFHAERVKAFERCFLNPEDYRWSPEEWSRLSLGLGIATARRRRRWMR